MAKKNEFVAGAEALQKRFKGSASVVAVGNGEGCRVAMEGTGAELIKLAAGIIDALAQEAGPVAKLVLLAILAGDTETATPKTPKKK
jgi:hypothetical protein